MPKCLEKSAQGYIKKNYFSRHFSLHTKQTKPKRMCVNEINEVLIIDIKIAEIGSVFPRLTENRKAKVSLLHSQPACGCSKSTKQKTFRYIWTCLL